MSDTVLLTDSGLETDLIFNHGVDLPDFAAFVLLDDPHGRTLLEQIYRDHIEVAEQAGLGIVLETPTWRASADWGARLGYGPADLARVNRDAVRMLIDLRDSAKVDVIVSGCVGPRGDGYVASAAMSVGEAQRYHAPQVRALAEAGADLVSALTMTTAAEATGFVQAVVEAGAAPVVSFTVEVDGDLPDGTSLADAVQSVDDATAGAARWFMVNCAHPQHVLPALENAGAWVQRVQALRVNASRKSHAELDESTELDAGDPVELATDVLDLRNRNTSLRIVGGCCGTDVRHVREIARALTSA